MPPKKKVVKKVKKLIKKVVKKKATKSGININNKNQVVVNVNTRPVSKPKKPKKQQPTISLYDELKSRQGQLIPDIQQSAPPIVYRQPLKDSTESTEKDFIKRYEQDLKLIENKRKMVENQQNQENLAKSKLGETNRMLSNPYSARKQLFTDDDNDDLPQDTQIRKRRGRPKLTDTERQRRADYEKIRPRNPRGRPFKKKEADPDADPDAE